MCVLNFLLSVNLFSLWVTSSVSRSSKSKKTGGIEISIENVHEEGISVMYLVNLQREGLLA